MDILEKLKKTNDRLVPELEKELKTTDTETEILYESMRYSTLSPGKRIRPFLVFEFAKLFGGTEEKAMKFALAIEIYHASSLVHDDMPCIDNDDLRRGRPTCHKAYGEGVALFCGDAMMVKAAEIACRNSLVAPEFALKAAETLLHCGGAEGMLGGQIIDLESVGKKIPFETLLKMHSLKTGALMRASARLGCLAAEVKPEDPRMAAADEYARAIGLSFQITDDILDAGTEEDKVNFLTFMSIDDAKKYAAAETAKAVNAIRTYKGSETLTDLAEFIYNRKA